MNAKTLRVHLFVATIAFIASTQRLSAECLLPYQISNGQTTDASQLMANLNALKSCFSTVSPAGQANSLQYNSGTGAFKAVGPLNDGQLVIGVTGGAPQARNLSAGSGVTISNLPGGIRISATGNNGLYGPVLSSIPTSINTGLTSWMNQGNTTTSDTQVGLSLYAKSLASGANVTGLYKPAPAPPYKVKALIAATRNSNSYNGVGIGWLDGTKIHGISYVLLNGQLPYFEIEKWNSPTSFVNNDRVSNSNGFSQPIWMQISDDGVNVSFSFSQDGVNFLDIYKTSKQSGFLGPNGYNNILFFANPQGSDTIGTLMSWSIN